MIDYDESIKKMGINAFLHLKKIDLFSKITEVDEFLTIVKSLTVDKQYP